MSTAGVKRAALQADGPRLAIEGGPAVRTEPLPPWPYFAPDELEAVRAVLASGKVNYWTGGECGAFETEFARYTGSKHAIALANGSVALELALHALGVGPGDDVVVPARSFMATASSPVLVGARPVFADVDPESGNISAQTLRAALTPDTRAAIVVHLGGRPCDMDPIMALAAERGFAVIEDCAQSHGATYKGRVTGSIGHLGAFSFCQDKIMTTGGEGGMLVMDDPALWARAWSYKDHGKSYDAVFNREYAPGFRWLHESFGTNWRMTEMQAAIGRRQLAKLPAWLAERRGNARLLERELAGTPGLRLVREAPDSAGAYYKYYVFLDLSRLAPAWTRQRVITAVSAEGIPCAEGSCSEMYLEKAYLDAGLAPAQRLQVARALGETTFILMVHPTMKEKDVLDTACAVRKVMTVAAAA